jgi:cyclohexyl-isocyanide hydratase
LLKIFRILDKIDSTETIVVQLAEHGEPWGSAAESNAGRLGECLIERSMRSFFVFSKLYFRRRVYGMKIAFVLFDRVTALDFVGFYDAITRLRFLKLMDDVTWDLCADREAVRDERGLTIQAGLVLPDLSGYDLVFVPGGPGTRELMFDTEFIKWLQTAAGAKVLVSVCTGALLLGAAGFLEGKRATTNVNAYELLAPYCQEVVKERIVRDGNVYTGAGVATSIDLGLYVVERLCGADAARKVQVSMDYPYYEAGKQVADK